TAPGPPTRRISRAWSTPRSPKAARPSSRRASTTNRASAPPTATPCRSANASCGGSGCAGCRRRRSGRSWIERTETRGSVADQIGWSLDFAGAQSGLRLLTSPAVSLVLGPLLRNHHILELARLVVDADLGRRDPAGELAGLLHRLHQLSDELAIGLRGQPLIL